MDNPDTRFDAFHVHRTTYKHVRNHDIAAVTLIPKDLQPGPHPVLVKFHGGGMVLGEAGYAPWFASWLVPFVLRNNAIVVMPNYRFIPESSGTDIMHDVADFWAWYRKDLPAYVDSISPGTQLDLGKLSVMGDSAGGLLALQTAIMMPKGDVKCVLGQYPMTNYLRRKPGPLPDGSPDPGPQVIDEHLANMRPGEVVSSAIPWDRFPISFTLAAYDRWREFYGYDENLYPIGFIKKTTYLPPTLIFHGEQDSAVSVEDSRTFVEKCQEVLDKEAAKDVRLVVVQGEHGFDVTENKYEEEEDWLREGLKWVEEKWLA
ncbi:alpha/beta-hydrolase [Sporormia fimetaria CBS 119925]|uniref:Alpha/beta-hydrolase n=1 Tax=Sporormia fimetaria CBS 119925 TaxID=1340428 RepID=A0A6A6VB85_9PLEO|nr:alpha/beta-hydrolase [Sporormia fimetaria CBS 119925]